MKQFAIKVAYDGTNYGGWQIQPNAKTIQQSLIDALACATAERVHVQGSGRTDSGVHAYGQIASFGLSNWRATAAKLVPAVNKYLPRDIVVRDCFRVVQDFDPIRQAKSKRYRYTIRNARVPDPMLGRFHWWIPKPLDIQEMQRAASMLEGTHDFKTFETAGSPRKTTTRTVYHLGITERPALDGMELQIDIEADGFLYNMVRNIVGVLWMIGSGRYGARWIEVLLDARARHTTYHTAPSYGLCLLEVRYPECVYLTDY